MLKQTFFNYFSMRKNISGCRPPIVTLNLEIKFAACMLKPRVRVLEALNNDYLQIVVYVYKRNSGCQPLKRGHVERLNIEAVFALLSVRDASVARGGLRS